MKGAVRKGTEPKERLRLVVRPPQPDVVALARWLLREARAGRAQSVAIVVGHGGTSVTEAFKGVVMPHVLVGSLACLQQKLVDVSNANQTPDQFDPLG